MVPRITRGCRACRSSARTAATHMIRVCVSRHVTDPGPNRPSSGLAGSSGLVYVYVSRIDYAGLLPMVNTVPVQEDLRSGSRKICERWEHSPLRYGYLAVARG